ncbi:entericidin A/B family lipoprotein [Halomonas alimentaria]|nr:entericidin A/B family lipoprotein [Halomonas alimentaria]
MKRTLTMLLAALFAVSLLSGCNTIRGAGQDIERGGEAIQDASD